MKKQTNFRKHINILTIRTIHLLTVLNEDL